jgi:molybdate transport system substrate-binding protein
VPTTSPSRDTPLVAATVVLLLTLIPVLAGCSADDGTATEDPSTTSTTTASASGAVTVSAAASLTESFTTIKDDFVEQNPDAAVTINFGSSGQLATQIESGAPADVAAFADEAPMTKLVDGGLIDGTPEIFARNQLVIVTKPGNPTGIEGLADLADAGVVSLCVDTAPCGRFADQALGTAGVTIPDSSITRGQDVKATLAAVSEGDAVAGIVYVTDASAAGDAVDRVDIPEAGNVVANYPIAVVKATTNGDAAAAFVAYVLGPDGRSVLTDAGFLSP